MMEITNRDSDCLIRPVLFTTFLSLLQDEDLLMQKRVKALSKPKKVSVGPHCPICDMREPPREHVSRHFGDELMDIVNGFPDPLR